MATKSEPEATRTYEQSVTPPAGSSQLAGNRPGGRSLKRRYRVTMAGAAAFGAGLVTLAAALVAGRTAGQALEQAAAAALTLLVAVLFVFLGTFTWGQYASAARFRHVLYALTSPAVLERSSWRDSVRITLGTALLLAAAAGLVADIPTSEGGAGATVWASLRMLLALAPIVIGAAWLLVDAWPDDRPEEWPTSEPRRPRYVVGIPTAVMAGVVACSVATVLWPDAEWLVTVTGLLLLAGIVALPYLLLVMACLWLGGLLAVRHLAHASRQFRSQWEDTVPTPEA